MSMKNAPRGMAGRSKTPPKGDVRPLGTPKPKKVSARSQKTLDSTPAPEVDSSHTAPTPAPEAVEQKHMTLSFKNLSKNGKTAFYTGAAVVLRFPVGAFPGKIAPASINVEDGALVGPKVKETKEERKARLAAMPKPTLAERIAKAEEKLAKAKAKLAASEASL